MFPLSQLVPLGFQTISLTTGTVSSLTVPTGAKIAYITADTQAARWRDDGTAPTSAAGMMLATGNPPLIYGGRLSAIQFIAASSGAILSVSYYSMAGFGA